MTGMFKTTTQIFIASESIMDGKSTIGCSVVEDVIRGESPTLLRCLLFIRTTPPKEEPYYLRSTRIPIYYFINLTVS